MSILHFTFHIESGSQAAHFVCIIVLQTDANRNPLLYLDEVARGIVLRYEGKGSSRSIGYGLHYTFIDYARNGIGRKGDRRTFFNMGEAASPGSWQ